MKALLCSTVFLCVGTGIANAETYEDQASFESVTTSLYTNGFDDVVAGPLDELHYSSGEYSYTITATGPANGSLYNYDGFVGAQTGPDGILITFTGADVTAIGGNFWTTDGAGHTIGGYLWIELDDGTSYLSSSTGPDNFRAITSSTPIQSVFIEIPGDNLWIAMDNLMIGQTVPTPSTLVAL
ncbi:MAG: hypothetical protein ACIAQF_10240, partial [Phycisphaerales bacterium JB065]